MEQLFNRDGTEFNGTPEHDDAGKPIRFVPVACDRCTVINGQRLWIMGINNGAPFSHTGFDCWTCNNSGVRGQRKARLYTAVQLARVNKSANTRAQRVAEGHRIAREQAEIARRDRETAYWANHADFIAKLNSLTGEYWDGFRQSFFARFEAPTARQIALVDTEVAKRQKNASSEFLGVVGQKIEFSLTIERIVVLHSEVYGTNYITIGRTPEGNVVTYKGLVDLGAVGETKTVKATVKEHTVYNNTRQTVIQRPKALEVA